MKTVDTTLTAREKGALATLVGRRFQKYRCDEFLFRPAVYQSVYLLIDGCAFEIESKERTLDYFGSSEDVSCLSFRRIKHIPAHSKIEGKKQVDTSVNERIRDIVIVEDTETMSDGGQVVYELRCTRAIIFVLPNRKFVFEKDVWLSEDVIIYRGQHAEDKIMPPSEVRGESEEFEFHTERTMISLASSLSVDG